MLDKVGIAKRIAREIKDGYYVNLGIGIPTLCANYIPEGMDVILQSENGLLGMGPFPFEGEEDPDVINAGKQTITMLPGSAVFDSAMSFGMIRAKKVNLTILGAMEVSGNGDIASWKIPGKMVNELNDTDIVGFDGKEGDLYLLVEKDFTCLDTVDEDQSDNYPNPLAEKLK